MSKTIIKTVMVQLTKEQVQALEPLFRAAEKEDHPMILAQATTAPDDFPLWRRGTIYFGLLPSREAEKLSAFTTKFLAIKL